MFNCDYSITCNTNRKNETDGKQGGHTRHKWQWNTTVGWLVSWCFEPSQPQRITSGLNTNFTLSPSYSFYESSYHKLCFLSLFIFRGNSARQPASGRATYFILRVLTGTMCLATANTGKTGRGFGKNAGEWTGRVEISKEKIPGSKRSRPSPSRRSYVKKGLNIGSSTWRDPLREVVFCRFDS